MRFPFFRNRDSVKNGILISIRRTGDGFHPGLFMQSVTASREALKTASVISCIRPLIAPYKIPISSIPPQRRFIEKTSARDFYILCGGLIKYGFHSFDPAEINIQILVDACFDCIGKGVLFRITGIKIVNQD